MSIRIPGIGVPINFGEVELKSSDWNDSMSALLGVTTESTKVVLKNSIRQALDRATVFDGSGDDVFVEAYTSYSGRNNTVIKAIVGLKDNYFYYDKEEPFILFEADELHGNFNINDCKIFEVENNKFLLLAAGNSKEEKIGKLLKTCFYGTSTTNPRSSTNARLVSSSFTNLTAVRTNIDEAVGATGHYFRLRQSTSFPRTCDITFNNPPGVNQCRIRFHQNNGGNAFNTWRVRMNSTTVHGPSGSNTDKTIIGTNPFDNPTTIEIQGDGGGSQIRNFTAFFLAPSGGVNYNLSSTSNFSINNIVDFESDESIPPFSFMNITELDYGVLTHELPTIFQKNMTVGIGSVLYKNFENGSNVEYKLLNDSSETDWMSMDSVKTFDSITPKYISLRLIPKDTDATPEFPAIRGFAFKSINLEE